MKKYTAIVVCALMLIISGCSDAKTNVSTSNEALLTLNGRTISEGNVYSALSASGNLTPITDTMTREVVKQAVEVTDEMEESAKATLQTTKETIGEDGWEDYLKEQGYEDEDDYYENSVLYDLQEAQLTQTYIDETFDTLTTTYEPRKLQVLVVTTENEESAREALEAEDADFAAIASQYGDTTTYNGSERVYTNQSGLPTAVWSAILETEKGELTDSVIDQTTTNVYIVKVVEDDPEEMKEDVESAFLALTATDEDGLVIADQAFNYYLNKFNFSIHDADIYTQLLSNSMKYQEK